MIELSHDVSDQTMTEIIRYMNEKGIDPSKAVIEYAGCGTHTIYLTYEVEANAQSVPSVKELLEDL